MTIAYTRTFRSGNSEAVRLPKEVAFGAGVELEIVKSGNVLTIRPKPKLTTRKLVEALRAIGPPADGVQARAPFEDPERPGL